MQLHQELHAHVWSFLAQQRLRAFWLLSEVPINDRVLWWLNASYSVLLEGLTSWRSFKKSSKGCALARCSQLRSLLVRIHEGHLRPASISMILALPRYWALIRDRALFTIFSTSRRRSLRFPASALRTWSHATSEATKTLPK